MKRTCFVTAAGTDIGKTYVLCRILEQLRAGGERVSAVKPVSSGFEMSMCVESDAGRIIAALGKEVDREGIIRIAPWRFRDAVSPDIAARREGQTVELAQVAAFCRESGSDQGRFHFIEGAGGVLSPLGQEFTNLDLIAALNCRSILVTGGYLGAISHSLTAVAAMRARNCVPVAIVLSGALDGPVSLQETGATISRFESPPVFIVDRDTTVPEDLLQLLKLTA